MILWLFLLHRTLTYSYFQSCWYKYTPRVLSPTINTSLPFQHRKPSSVHQRPPRRQVRALHQVRASSWKQRRSGESCRRQELQVSSYRQRQGCPDWVLRALVRTLPETHTYLGRAGRESKILTVFAYIAKKRKFTKLLLIFAWTVQCSGSYVASIDLDSHRLA